VPVCPRTQRMNLPLSTIDAGSLGRWSAQVVPSCIQTLGPALTLVKWSGKVLPDLKESHHGPARHSCSLASASRHIVERRLPKDWFQRKFPESRLRGAVKPGRALRMPLRYLFGPVQPRFAEENLGRQRRAGSCLTFNGAGTSDLTIGP